ncbi:helix-turn-helix domain-containing protein [Brevibacillus laterosporus]|uniref:helix-turn-helix domain-containing protein n=1 Tax=Brevibacillus laterosporus TaxID=1465 RepID=UPI002650587B|nr:helix-turn-helix domain-containing protein [Brevibacillus laterosporus]MDN9011565.1 helix-turn-helix domain-containing protein [Brevibacillus laterosporus]MDO0942611.1 helix-turn-helix domain-containing protein [Brevibacillus laterosporus]
MSSAKKTYSLEFKHHVVECFEQGTTYREIRETYGLDLRMFRRWVRRYRDDGLKGLEGLGGKQEKQRRLVKNLFPRRKK